ncbi:MAG: DEAD/DEAH box helicase family protein [Pseudomonadota bacterium]|nr:DEAD/DEAH box helicase family protein [Pseudomonadota bacterium]
MSETTQPAAAGLRLQFAHQDYQHRAVQAVVQAFDGQPLSDEGFRLHGAASVDYAADGSIANRLLIAEAQMLQNVQKVQAANGIEPVAELAADREENRQGSGQFCPHFTLEMETGTGKTYTFIKTMYELNKVYGFKKFVIVVPSVAIREGTMKNLAITRAHFAQDYGNVPCVPILYDSARLNDLRHFAQGDALSVLVINIDSFAKDGNKIKQQGERAFAPIEYIRAVSPIVIVDEPQNFETDIRQRALRDLNPLCTLRYSATHKNTYNLLYSLNPVQAYDLGLVKQIEVDGIEAQDGHNQAFVELVKIEAKAKSLAARLRVDVNGKTGVLRKEITLKPGEDLHDKSGGREVYAEGYVLNDIRGDEVEFSGGRILRVGQRQDALQDAVMRYQIERTIKHHLDKLKKLKPLGIKVLSLFFIDKVAHYRQYDADGNAQPGKFAVWLEEIFAEYARRPQYQGLIGEDACAVHNGYFSGDRKGKGDKAQTIWKDTGGHTAKDDDTYALIMRDKERLLSLDEPLQFIFSHSALREGWDNPNVFQICTLNDTRSTLKKRQEIGRGLRLCVNAQGERVHEKNSNVLTVVANESYEDFARQLQAEIQEDTGVSFAGRTQNARAKVRVQRKPLNAEEQALFEAIWQKINYQTRYSVKLDSQRLVADCIKALADVQQYPRVARPKVISTLAGIHMDETGVAGVAKGVGQSDAGGGSAMPAVIPDVYAYIQSRVHISRASVFAILDGSGRLDELALNPQAFLDMAVQAMRNTLQALQVEGIEYREINGRRYEMTLFEPVETYLSSVYPPGPDARTPPLHKTLMQAQPLQDPGTAPVFDCVPSDSEVESRFARDCALDARVRFFFKLPGAFKVDTPLGRYNPDWAVVFEDDKRVYFVAETKSSLVEGALRRNEELKIECGKKHFAARAGQVVNFKAVKNLQELV